MIPYARQTVSDKDVQAVVDVLRSDFLTQGPKVPEFETEIARLVGAEHCVAVNSATSGLHVACLALGVGPGDVVWTSAISFVASANCARMCGAEVGFVDIDPLTLNISSKELRRRLEIAAHGGVLPKVLIVVHMAGQPADMREIAEICAQYSVLILEDASHAIGARYESQAVGSCEYSQAVVFSFHPVKIITTGEGGAVTTNSPSLAKTMRLLRSHGITRNQDEFENQSADPWYYEQQLLGFNYRMTDMQAALGLSQLNRAEENLIRRKEIARFYHAALSGVGDLQLPHADSPSETEDHAWHLYVVRTQKRKALYDYLREHHIFAQVHYFPLHLMPHYRTTFGYGPGLCPQAERFYSECLSIPMYPSLSQEQLSYVVDAIRAFFDQIPTNS
jgi:UDP-4-amino-4,6-dideoxy-N-acetyl-beta-L-altrosamine transaminase